MSDWRIALSQLEYGPEEEKAVLRVLRSRWLSMGPEVQAFENEFAEFLGAKHAVAVANGTAALHMAYLVAGIGPGDEVIQPALNFVAAANMTIAIGAKPVFADILDLDQPTLAPEEIERCLTPKTKAVVVMHYGGAICCMDEIADLCLRHGLILIEDACHAVGARYTSPLDGSARHGKAAGLLGDIGCFSFFSNKNLPVGEGGMVTTNRDEWAESLQRLRSHGMTTLTWDRHRGHAYSYDVTMHGCNYRMDEIRAALGREQLRKLAAGNSRREYLANYYRHLLADVSGISVPFSHGHRGSAFHLMAVLAADAEHRARLTSALAKAKVQSSLHYPDITSFRALQGYRREPLQRSRSFSERVITLPLYPSLKPSEVEEICSVLKAVA